MFKTFDAEHLQKIHGNSQHSEYKGTNPKFAHLDFSNAEQPKDYGNDHTEHFNKVIEGAKRQFYGKPTAEQVENHARNFHFNSHEATKRFKDYKAYGKAVREHFEKTSQHSEKLVTFTPRQAPILGAPIQFREEQTQTEQFDESQHQHIMERMGYKRFKGDSYIHGPTNGQHSVTKDSSGKYHFLSSTKSRHNKNDMSRKELYEHLDRVHGGFQSLTRKTPHEAASQHDELPGGRGDNAKASGFDPDQVSAGVKHEMEHTSDPKIAMEIALDHLSEDPQYYTKLNKMEKE